jgi:hypothetical protein
MMSITQRLRTVIQGIAPPAIMHTGALEVGQNVHRLNRLTSTLGVDKVVGQGLGTGSMEPHQFALDAQPVSSKWATSSASKMLVSALASNSKHSCRPCTRCLLTRNTPLPQTTVPGLVPAIADKPSDTPSSSAALNHTGLD